MPPKPGPAGRPATTTASAFSRGVSAATSASAEPVTSSASAVEIVASTRRGYPCSRGSDGEADGARPARLSRDRRPARRGGTGDPRRRPLLRPGARAARRRRLVRAGDPPARADDRAGEARALRDAPGRLRPAGRERRRLRTDVPRARGRRLGRPQRRLGPGLAGDVLDLEVGLGGAEA